MEEWVDDETRLVLAFIKSKGELVASLADDAKYKEVFESPRTGRPH